MKKLMSLILVVMMALSFSVIAEEEVIKLTWACGTGGVAPIDNAIVVEALNEISREKIGVEVEYSPHHKSAALTHKHPQRRGQKTSFEEAEDNSKDVAHEGQPREQC